MRKLRTAEREIVDQAVGSAMNLAWSPLDEIATVIEQAMLDVPPELSDQLIRDLMNEIGRDLFGRFSLSEHDMAGGSVT